MIDERREEQAGLYVLGVLPAEELREFEATMRLDDKLQQLVIKLRNASDVLAITVPHVTPPPGLKNRIFAELDRREAQGRKVVPFEKRESDIAPVWLPWALAAAFAVACAVVWNQGNAVKTQSETMRRHLDELNQRSAQLNRDASDMQRQLALLQTELKELRDKDWLAQLQIAMLSSALKESQAVAVTLWNQEKQEGVFAVERLGLLPADKDYQLWVIDPNNPNPVDAGLFSVVDEKGRVVYKFTPKASVQKAAKFAVSIEKKGGAEKPTVDQIVLIGG